MPHGGYGVLAHHNSADRPETVDPKSLRDLMVMNAAYTYFLASAGAAEKRWIAEVALTRGYAQITAAAGRLVDQAAVTDSRESLGRLLHQGPERIEYQLGRESQSVRSAADLKEGLADLAAFAQKEKARVTRALRDRAAALGIDAGADSAARPCRGRPDCGPAQAYGHDHPRRPRARATRGLARGVVLGAAGIRPVLVRRQARPGGGHPAHRARDGPAELRFRRLLPLSRKARLRGVRARELEAI